ncbi:MarR family transcriptional regulator [Streptomyces sp. GbtcB6]|uniref:MarR family transcriptional regulator n=1 Tax=Streptomyces sp. GbtcB6 TaxID=2824751 RepID=UPI0034D5265F
MARLLGVNETDLRCKETLLQYTPGAAPSQLAAWLGLTTSSATTMLDRLEMAGYAARQAPHRSAQNPGQSHPAGHGPRLLAGRVPDRRSTGHGAGRATTPARSS